jgi:Caspase domain
MFANATVRTLALGVMLAVGLFAAECAAGSRVALVVGNAGYRSVPELRNSRNDADDVSSKLKQVGFEVVDGRDLDRPGMQATLIQFAQRLAGSEAALVYYSGHGLQINGQNFLVPVDAAYRNGDILPLELIKLDEVIEALGYTTGVRLLVLDACRDNPLVNNLPQNRRSRGGVTNGLARIERSLGMLIAYSTQANAVADDGDGRNSPFTAALVRDIAEPGLEVATLFRRVAVNVNRETRGAQTPELSISLLQDFYFNPQESDVDAWKKLGPSSTPRELESFIARFPASVMVDAVRARIDAIATARERERLVREFGEKERRLRQELETAEAGYRKALAEFAERRAHDERTRVATEKAGEGKAGEAPAPPLTMGLAGTDPPALTTRPEDLQREKFAQDAVAKAERERLSSQVAAFEADKTRLAIERLALERAMTESLARAQAERERAEKRLATETARLPVLAADQPRTASPPTRQPLAQKCREINMRAQLGDLSGADRDILQRQCR